MKEILYSDIVKGVKEICMEANFNLGSDVIDAFRKGIEAEESPVGRDVLKQLIENAEIAADDKIAMCQDTGFAVFFVEMGDTVRIAGGAITDAINEGVRLGYDEGCLRKSICHPFTRKNTGDNTPAVIHYEPVPGDRLKITIAPKGGGSENMSGIAMLNPSDGVEGVVQYVVGKVIESGANPCPPVIVGVGIGGTFEKAALLSKKALLRTVGSVNPDQEAYALEKVILDRINRSGVGPQGLGGRVTALAVHVIIHPCHMASLPVAVNINCHAYRHKEIEF
ncbi:MAG: fumarate hydratase [Spirochaetes bacterium RBG_13_51_14]|nr:MAG: fumarate hydratase [Spirochaetes bacterium RBG_13_51_14]